jgi:hypothetical protein
LAVEKVKSEFRALVQSELSKNIIKYQYIVDYPMRFFCQKWGAASRETA